MYTFSLDEQIKLLKQRVKERSAQITLMENSEDVFSKDFVKACQLEQAFDKRVIGSLTKLKEFYYCISTIEEEITTAYKMRKAKLAYKNAVNADMEANIF